MRGRSRLRHIYLQLISLYLLCLILCPAGFPGAVPVRAAEEGGSDSGWILVDPVENSPLPAEDVMSAEPPASSGKMLLNTDGFTGKEAAPGEVSRQLTENVRVVVNKYLTEQPDGTKTITLEQYLTGAVEEQQELVPTDVVLVLDYSYSMEGEAMRRMNDAAVSFVRALAAENEGLKEEERARLGIIAFGGNKSAEDAVAQNWGLSGGRKLTVLDSTTVDSAAAFIAGRTTTLGNTWTDAALAKAQEFLSYDSAGRKKVVVLVTDGYPYHEVLDGSPNTGDSEADREAIMKLGAPRNFMFTLTAANRALHTAYALKQAGARIYTCYISNGVTEDSPSFEAFSSVQSLSELPDTTDALGFRFLYMLSSANPGAYQLLTPTIYDRNDPAAGGMVDETFFRVANTLPAIAPQLNRIYAQVLTEMFGNYRSGVIARDVISWPFELGDGKSQETSMPETVPVRTYTADARPEADGSFSFGPRREISGLNICRESNLVEVFGFDYGENAVTTVPHAGTEQDYGRKLIIEFEIRQRESFGGNQVNTNGASSGLYNGSEQMCLYPVPRTDLPVKYDLIAADRTVYVPEEVIRQGLVEADPTGGPEDMRTGLIFCPDFVPDGRRNAFVDIHYELVDQNGQIAAEMDIPAGTAYVYDTNSQTGNLSWQWKETEPVSGTYRVTAAVTPVANTVAGASSSAEGSQNETIYTKEAKLFIFRPEITAQDSLLSGPREENGIRIPGDQLDFEPGLSAIPAAAGTQIHSGGYRWVCDVEGAVPRKTEPGVSWTLTPLSGVQQTEEAYLVTAKEGEDIPVRAVVSRIVDGKNTQIRDADILWKHVCGVREEDSCSYHADSAGSADYASQQVRFLIHVQTPMIPDITKSAKAPLVLPGEEIVYEITAENTRQQEISASVLDVFPWNQDENGSVFSGELSLNTVELDLSGAAEASPELYLTASGLVREKTPGELRTLPEGMKTPLAAADTAGGSSEGAEAAAGTILTAQNIPADTTAMLCSLTLKPGEKAVIRLTFTAKDCGGGDCFINRARIMTDLLIRESPKARVEVVSRRIAGRMFLDENRNGLRDTGEAPVCGQAVRLLRPAQGQDREVMKIGELSADDVYDEEGLRIQPVLTGEDGTYCFENVPAGTYLAVFEIPEEELTPTKKKAGEDPTLDSDAEEKKTDQGLAVILNIDLTEKVNLTDPARIRAEEHLDVGLVRGSGQIRIVKTIDRRYLPFGPPQFIFRVAEESGAYRNVLLSVPEGEDSAETILQDLPYGNYTVTELGNARYQTARISVLENGAVQEKEGKSVFRTTLSAGKPVGAAEFVNELRRDDLLSHSASCVNTAQTDLPVRMDVTYLGPAEIVSETDARHHFAPGEISAQITYDNGSTRTLLYDGTNLTLSPSELDSSMNSGGGTFPVRVVYTERGVTLTDSFEVSVRLKAERIYQVIYLPNKGSFDLEKERNIVRYRYDEAEKRSYSIAGTYEKPGRNSYCFGGWSTAAQGGAFYPDGSAMEELGAGTESVYTLYAQWLAAVTFDANGGRIGDTDETTAVEEHRTGLPVGTSLCGSWDETHVFREWNTKADGSGTRLEDYGRLEEPVTFYAIYDVKAEQIYNYTGGVQTFTAPAAGQYCLEVWGAQSGTGGAKGGYSRGIVSLQRGETLYVYVGGAGGDGKGVTPGTGGYNGGGKGGSGGTTQHISTTGYPTKQTFFGATAGGGGATHIARTDRGVLSTYRDHVDELLIVAGGGSKNPGNAGGGSSFGQGIGGRGTPEYWYDSAGGNQRWGPDVGGGGGFEGGTYNQGGTGYTEGLEEAGITAGDGEMPVCQPGKVIAWQIGNSGDGHARITLLDGN